MKKINQKSKFAKERKKKKKTHSACCYRFLDEKGESQFYTKCASFKFIGEAVL